DFTLQSGSPAIDANIEQSPYQTFFNLYGIDINVDNNEIDRPQGSNWDMGAFEYTGVTSTAPAAPTFDPGSGIYNSAQDVDITPAVNADNTYYTTDGSNPDNTDMEYLGGTILISGANEQTITLKAVSYNESGIGVIGTALYTFDTVGPDAPTFTPPTGSYDAAQNVVINEASDANTTYYTTDGSQPDSTDTQYFGGTVSIDGDNNQTITLNAVSYDIANNKGEAGTAFYTFDKDVPEIGDFEAPIGIPDPGLAWTIDPIDTATPDR
ncbi:unnamed protein product, partial [marine sediment metagenome]